MKSRDQQPRLLYPAKISFKIGRQKRASQTRKYIIIKPLSDEMLKGLKKKKKIKTMNNKMAINT